MSKIKELIRGHKYEELWQMSCGFIDISLGEFMAIQRRLLEEQLSLLKNCDLGRKVMRGAKPETVEEFRRDVPLTTYADYCPELLEKREDVLPAKPLYWIHTSGKSGEYPFKWVPISQRVWDELGPVLCATRLFIRAKHKGDVNIQLNIRLLHATAPMPYASGLIANKLEEEFGYKYFPPISESEQMPFMERVEKGFWMALSEGISGVYGLAGVLVAIGERFKNKSSNIKLSTLLSRPRALLRLSIGLIRSKLARRPMLPRDIWSITAVSCTGTDSVIYKNKIKEMWGALPLDVYASTEALMIAMQTWDRTSLTFVPTMNFLEFIPEAEHLKWHADHSYHPKTVLLDEVKAGQDYELVITNFHGGAMVRYRVGDMIRITALRNDALNIDIPQMAFLRRADELIDIAGFTRLTEKIIWQAIENTGISYVDWTLRKDAYDGKPVLHIYLELKDGAKASEQVVASAVHDQLKMLDDDYTNLQSILGLRPIVVTLLKGGAFQAFAMKRMAEGADLAHLKPNHINASDQVLSMLGVEV
jgi:hypothetical protein